MEKSAKTQGSGRTEPPFGPARLCGNLDLPPIAQTPPSRVEDAFPQSLWGKNDFALWDPRG